MCQYIVFEYGNFVQRNSRKVFVKRTINVTYKTKLPYKSYCLATPNLRFYSTKAIVLHSQSVGLTK